MGETKNLGIEARGVSCGEKSVPKKGSFFMIKWGLHCSYTNCNEKRSDQE